MSCPGCMKLNGNRRSPFFILMFRFRSASTSWVTTTCHALGYMFLDVIVKDNTWYHITSDWPQTPSWPSLKVLLFFSRANFLKAQVYGRWMLYKSNKYSSEVLMSIFFFFSYLAGCRDHEHCGMGVEKHISCVYLYDWRCSLQAKEKEVCICQEHRYRDLCQQGHHLTCFSWKSWLNVSIFMC